MLSVLLASALANAGEFKSAGQAAPTGVETLTLYRGVDPADPFWYVEAKINEKPVLLRIASENAGLQLTEKAAKRVGLKPAGDPDKNKEHAQVPALMLGGLKITGIDAKVKPVKPFAVGTDGQIGIAAFSGLAWAVEPGKGQVHVGPSGAGSVAESIGTVQPFSQVGASKQRVGKETKDIPAQAFSAEAKISNVSVPVSVSSGSIGSWAATEVDGADWFSVGGVPNPAYPLPAVNGQADGESELEWREIAFGPVARWSMLERRGLGLTYRFRAPAAVGIDVLQHADLGVDAGRRLYAVRSLAGSNEAVSYAPVLEGRLRAEVDAAGVDVKDPDAARSAKAGKLGSLTAFLTASTQFGAAAESARKWTEAAPERCDSWLALGTAQLRSGDAAGSVAALQKAGELYQGWAVRPLSERTRLAASEEKRSKEANFDGVWSQSNSCHVAWGLLAEANLAAGHPEAVAELYPKYDDLDSNLPLEAGSALLVRGDLAGAEAAFRRALQLSHTTNGFARGGMMLAVGDRAPDLALAQFEGNIDEEQGTLRYFLLYGELLKRQGGSDGSIKGLSAYLAASPWRVPGWLALANAQADAGASNAESVKSASDLLATLLRESPAVGSLHAWNAEALRLSGKFPEAAAEAEKATTLDPANGLGWFVRGRVAASAGDTARAMEMYRQAGVHGAWDPLYASLLAAAKP